jgi:hypothetical protein
MSLGQSGESRKLPALRRNRPDHSLQMPMTWRPASVACRLRCTPQIVPGTNYSTATAPAVSKAEQSCEAHSPLFLQALAEIRSKDAREPTQEQRHRRTLCTLGHELSDRQKPLRRPAKRILPWVNRLQPLGQTTSDLQRAFVVLEDLLRKGRNLLDAIPGTWFLENWVS